MQIIGFVFDTLLINPLTNLFVMLTALTGSAGMGVILLTLVIRMVTLPLQIRQMHSMKVMSAITPRIQELQRKYKDPRRRQEETMKIYREAGINPFGCFSSMLLQFPILIALYRTFSAALGQTPEALMHVSERLYDWSYLRDSMPLPDTFLWMNLGQPDPLAMPLLVGVTTYVLQKMTQIPATTDQQRAQNGMMNLLMPMMFVFITINLPSGLSLYYVLSNTIGILMQYLYVGGGPINWKAFIGLNQDPVLPRAAIVRQAQLDAYKNVGRDSEDPDEEGETPVGARGRRPPPQPASGSGTRRRYTNGRRRNRR